jgi:hypothetical protein
MRWRHPHLKDVPLVTKRIRITRSVLVSGKHAEAGSVHLVTKPVADDLIGAACAVPVRSGWWIVGACLVLGVGVLVWLGMVWLWHR